MAAVGQGVPTVRHCRHFTITDDLMTAQAQSTITPRERILTFAGSCNFRDIGGYQTRHGASVRWGRVYRAGVLSYFTAEDEPRLSGLGLKAICDLRRAEERQYEPTRWPDLRTRPLAWEDGTSVPTIRALSATRTRDAAGMFDTMVNLYRQLPRWMSGRVAGLLGCVARDDVPLLVHCAAGKDRTGLAVAVLLMALEVPQDTVLEDYLLTNQAGDFEGFIRDRQQSRLGLGETQGQLLNLPDEMRRVLFSADPAFLEAALESIEQEFGDVESYLAQAGITDAQLQQVRDRLLE